MKIHAALFSLFALLGLLAVACRAPDEALAPEDTFAKVTLLFES